MATSGSFVPLLNAEAWASLAGVGGAMLMMGAAQRSYESQEIIRQASDSSIPESRKLKSVSWIAYLLMVAGAGLLAACLIMIWVQSQKKPL